MEYCLIDRLEMVVDARAQIIIGKGTDLFFLIMVGPQFQVSLLREQLVKLSIQVTFNQYWAFNWYVAMLFTVYIKFILKLKPPPLQFFFNSTFVHDGKHNFSHRLQKNGA